MPVNPPRPRGPHLNAMRSFEASARLGGFAAAAEELGVTAGAISQQVRNLENWIGAPLFERHTQGVSLSKLGQDTAEQFSAAFDTLGLALNHLRQSAPDAPIHIAALPSVAQLWLSPRLPQIREALPGTQLSVTALEKEPNLHREVFDLSLFYTQENNTGSSFVLSRDVIFPVCTPEIASRLRKPDDLCNETLLTDSTWSHDWSLYASATGIAAPLPQGPIYSLYALALEDACNGAGVLMGHSALVEQHLHSGRLVIPFVGEVPTGLVLCARTVQPTTPGQTLHRLLSCLR